MDNFCGLKFSLQYPVAWCFRLRELVGIDSVPTLIYHEVGDGHFKKQVRFPSPALPFNHSSDGQDYFPGAPLRAKQEYLDIASIMETNVKTYLICVVFSVFVSVLDNYLIKRRQILIWCFDLRHWMFCASLLQCANSTFHITCIGCYIYVLYAHWCLYIEY